jgi:hypothetical protein
MTPEGKCEKCGFVEEDNGLHVYQLHADRFRLRGMIQYAKDAPDFDSCKSILSDALDGVNGAENYDEVKGRLALLEKVAKAAKMAVNGGTSEWIDLKAALRSLGGR